MPEYRQERAGGCLSGVDSKLSEHEADKGVPVLEAKEVEKGCEFMEEGNQGALPETESPVSIIDPFAGGVKEIVKEV